MTQQLCKWRVAGLAAAACLAVGAPAWAHDFKQLRVVVNQLDGTTVPDLQQREKDMNDILKQCQKYGVYLQVTIAPADVHTNQNPTRPDGTEIAPGGKVPNNGGHAGLRDTAEQGEVKTNGVKIWVAKEVRIGTNSVASSNEVVNGGAYLGRPSATIGQQSGVNGDQHTWTHELGHTLGLDDVDSSATTNLMNMARTVGGAATGNGLTEQQCKDLQKGADARSPATGKTKEQTNQPPAKTVSYTLTDTPASTPWDFTIYDLDSAHLIVDYHLLNPTTPALYVDTFVNATFDPPPVVARYLVWLDLDNDLATGDAAGFDAVIIQQLTSPTEGMAVLRWLPGGMEQTLPLISAKPVKLCGTGETNAWVEVVGSVIRCQVPLVLLPGMGAVIRVGVSSANELLETYDVIEPEQMSRVPPPEPLLQLNVIETLPGNVVMVHGEGFTPSTAYRITYDSTVRAEGMTGPAGEIETSFVAPELVPGDYLVDAMDSACRVQIAVLRMLDNQGLKIRVEGPELVISFRTHPGPTYIVEYKENLGAPGPWMELQRTNTVERLVTLHDTPPPDQPRFYRWRQE